MTFVELYKPKEGEELIVWNDPYYEGFSVLRTYPPDCGFIPIKKPNGEDDTRVLIKVGRSRRDVDIKDGKAVVHVSVSKFQKYLSGRFQYDFNDPESPTKSSIDASNESPQPIDLQDSNRYLFDVKTEKIFDLETKKNVPLESIIEKMYGDHLATIRGRRAFVLKGKIASQNWICNTAIPKIQTGLLWVNEVFLGKQIIENPNNWGEGLFKPYSHARLTTVYPHAIPFFQSNSQISKAAVFWIAVCVLVSRYLLPEHFQPDSVASIAGIVILIFVFDSWLPHFLLAVVNGLIHFRRWFGFRPFSFK